MGWDSSRRKSELPSNWQQLRAQAKARANGTCEHRTNGARCTNPGAECHHAGDKNDHRLEVLEWICVPCHKRETNQQGKAAQHAMYVTARKRTPERHPGTPVYPSDPL